MISKWTLRIKDPDIWKDFIKTRMDHVLYIMRVIIVFKTFFFLNNVYGLFTDRLVNNPRFGISAVSFLLAAVPYVLTLATKKTVFFKLAPLIHLAFHSIADNCLVYYLLSEEGMREGQEQFGDEYATKLGQLVITLRGNIMASMAIGVTLIGPEWHINSIS